MEKEKEQKIEIINDIKIIDYSRKFDELHIKFIHKGEEDDPNDESQFNGSEIEFKFKDPRDTLKFLVDNWKSLDSTISLRLFNFVSLGISLGNYNPMQIYYTIILNFQLNYLIKFITFNGMPLELDDTIPEEDKKGYLDKISSYKEGLNTETRLSHIWAVKNTWWYYNYYRKTLNDKKKDSHEQLLAKKDLFTNYYKGKKIKDEFGFLLDERLWKVTFTDGSWIIAFDVGNGWYEPMTDFNSYKINIPY